MSPSRAIRDLRSGRPRPQPKRTPRPMPDLPPGPPEAPRFAGDMAEMRRPGRMDAMGGMAGMAEPEGKTERGITGGERMGGHGPEGMASDMVRRGLEDLAAAGKPWAKAMLEEFERKMGLPQGPQPEEAAGEGEGRGETERGEPEGPAA